MRQTKKLFCLVLSFYLILWTQLTSAEPDFYRSHETGWHWYNEDTIGEKKTPQEIEQEHVKSIKAEKKAAQEKIQTALDEWVLHPTVENAKKYYLLQIALLNQSDRVSESAREMFLKYPELDYGLIYPSNSMARKIASDQQKTKEDKAIKLLSQKIGLFFFYRSTCPYCRKFAPTLKLFADAYHIKIIPITTDGISLPEFPNSYKDKGQTETFQVKVEPAVFVVNPYTQKAFPITYGLISFDELRNKMLDVIPLVISGDTNENNN